MKKLITIIFGGFLIFAAAMAEECSYECYYSINKGEKRLVNFNAVSESGNICVAFDKENRIFINIENTFGTSMTKLIIGVNGRGSSMEVSTIVGQFRLNDVFGVDVACIR